MSLQRITDLKSKLQSEQEKLKQLDKIIVEKAGEKDNVDLPEHLVPQLLYSYVRKTIFEARLKKAMKGT